MTAVLTDPLTLTVSGADYETLIAALVDAYPSYPELRAMTRFRLDLNLATIAGENTPIDRVAFDLIEDQRSKGYFLRLLSAARASRPGNPKLAAFAERFDLALATPPQPTLERIVRDTNSFLDISTWRERLAEIEGRVCRVEVQTNQGLSSGTGFLVGPDLVLTNYHVVEAVIFGENNQYTAGGARAKIADVRLRFDYKVVGGAVTAGTEARLAEIVDYSPYSPIDLQGRPKAGMPEPDHLDHALLRLETAPGRKPLGSSPIGEKAEPGAPARGAVTIPAADWSFQPGAPLFIVQHPEGEPMKLAFDTDAVMEVNGNGTRVLYKTNTLGGSSGSPCFNQHLELVALHHAGDPKYAALYHPEFNEGVPIAAIRQHLKAKGKDAGVTIA
jgi:V8-like Glu-specific endopeptidase